MSQKETLTVHFYLSTHPSEKLVFALSGTQTHASLSCVLSPVWGCRGKDTLSSEEKLGPWDLHAAKSPR